MSEYTQQMDALIAKKDPNKEEKKAYQDLWINMVKESGFQGEGEEYLYKGIKFDVSLKMKEYILQGENPLERLRQFFEGRLYGDKCDDTFRLANELLVGFLNEKKPQTDLIGLLIKKYRAAAQKKNSDKLTANRESIFANSFVHFIEDDFLPLPFWEEFQLSSEVIEEFCLFISNLIDGCENAKMNSIRKRMSKRKIQIDGLKNWISLAQADKDDKASTPSENAEDNRAIDSRDENTDNAPSSNLNSGSISNPDIDKISAAKSSSAMIQELILALTEAQDIAFNINEQSKQNRSCLEATIQDERERSILMQEQYEKELAQLKEALEKETAHRQNQEEMLQKLECEKVETAETIRNLEKTAEEREILLAQKTEELETLHKKTNALALKSEQDTGHCFAEVARALKSKYSNFKAVKDLTADDMGGEDAAKELCSALIMDLADVFETLKKNGIKL